MCCRWYNKNNNSIKTNIYNIMTQNGMEET